MFLLNSLIPPLLSYAMHYVTSFSSFYLSFPLLPPPPPPPPLSLSLSFLLGSGKSYTMMGTGSDEPATKGLIPRICDGLFAKMKEVGGTTCISIYTCTFLFFSLSL